MLLKRGTEKQKIKEKNKNIVSVTLSVSHHRYYNNEYRQTDIFGLTSATTTTTTTTCNSYYCNY